MTKARQSESDLLSEESNELLVVQHAVMILIDHGNELLRFRDGAGHPSMLRQYLGQLLAAYPTASNDVIFYIREIKTKTQFILSVLIKNEKSLFKVVFRVAGFSDLDLKCSG